MMMMMMMIIIIIIIIKTGVVILGNGKGSCMLIYVAVSGDRKKPR